MENCVEHDNRPSIMIAVIELAMTLSGLRPLYRIPSTPDKPPILPLSHEGSWTKFNGPASQVSENPIFVSKQMLTSGPRFLWQLKRRGKRLSSVRLFWLI